MQFPEVCRSVDRSLHNGICSASRANGLVTPRVPKACHRSCFHATNLGIHGSYLSNSGRTTLHMATGYYGDAKSREHGRPREATGSTTSSANLYDRHTPACTSLSVSLPVLCTCSGLGRFWVGGGAEWVLPCHGGRRGRLCFKGRWQEPRVASRNRMCDGNLCNPRANCQPRANCKPGRRELAAVVWD